MINESNQPIEYWLKHLGISLEAKGDCWIFRTFLLEEAASKLMAYRGWNPEAQMSWTFRNGILSERELEENNPNNLPLEKLTEKDIVETSCLDLEFETKGMAMVSILPLYGSFGEQWQADTYEPNKDLVGSLDSNRLVKRVQEYLESRKWENCDSIFVFENEYEFSDRQIAIKIDFSPQGLNLIFLDENGKNETTPFAVEERNWSHFEDFVMVMEQINNWQSGT